MTEANAVRNFMVAIWVFTILMFIGWVLNIIDLVGMVGGEITTMFILRIVGVFAAPLGSILGWFF